MIMFDRLESDSRRLDLEGGSRATLAALLAIGLSVVELSIVLMGFEPVANTLRQN